MTHTILLVPTEEHRAALLAIGAPVAWPWDARNPTRGVVCGPARDGEVAVSWLVSTGEADFGSVPPEWLALVLAWEGEPVADGCDRAARALAAGEVRALGEMCAIRGVGTVVA